MASVNGEFLFNVSVQVVTDGELAFFQLSDKTLP